MKVLSCFSILFLLCFAAAMPTVRAGEIQVRGGPSFANDINTGDTTPTTVDDTDYGVMAVGNTRTHTFRIHNLSGSSQLFVQSVTEDSPAFEVLSGGGTGFINAGGFRDVEIRLNPTSAGTKTATVSILNDDSTEGLYTFTLTAEITGDPEISLTGKLDSQVGAFTAITDGDTTPATANGTAFGNVNVGSANAATIQIENTGTAQLVIDSITSSSGQFLVSGAPAVVGVGQTQSFQVVFTPTTFGAKAGTITIQNNDANEDPFTFSVSGTGRAADIDVLGGTSLNLLIVDGDTTPSVLDQTDFGTQPANVAAARTFRLRNNGNESLFISSISEDSPAFSISGVPSPVTPIAAGGTNDFTITLNATSAGTKNTTVTVISNAPNAEIYTFDITAEVTGEPEIVLTGKLDSQVGSFSAITDGDTTPATVNGTAFGNVAVGSANAATIQIENTGTAQLVIDSITSSTGDFLVSGAPAVVGVNQTQTFQVAFAPTSFGAKAATITIQNNDANEDPFTFSVSGTGLGPDIVVQGGPSLNVAILDGDVTPTTADGTDFGSVTAGGSSSAVQFRIRNNGNDTLSISAVSEDGAAFSLSGAPGITNPIPAGAVDDFTITFSPTSAGLKEATVTITSNDPDENPYTFKVTGTGLGSPEIVVRGQATPVSAFIGITDGDTTPGNALDGTAFGQTAVSGGSVSHLFQIENTGTGQLTLDSISENSPHFSITSIPPVVGVNQTQTFVVTFNPSLHGTHQATITIQNNDSDEDPFTFTVVGEGTAPDIAILGGSALSQNIQDGDVSPRTADGTDFGVVNVTTGSLATTFSIRNNGNDPLTITSAISSDPQFTLAGIPSITSPIAPAAQNNFTVTFDPSSTGQKTAVITLQSNDPDESPFTFTVTGYGGNNQPSIQVTGEDSSVFTNGQTSLSTAAGTDFGSTAVAGGSVARTFQINNTGTGPLTISGVAEGSPHFAITAAPGGAIPPGDSGTVIVTYDPTAAGTHNATVTIASDATNAPSFSFDVRGTGSTTAPAEPEIVVLGGSSSNRNIPNLDTTPRPADGTAYGPLELGAHLSRTFRIANTGNLTLTVIAMVSTRSEISVDDTAFIVPPGSFHDVSITVTANTIGPVACPITIVNSDVSESPFIFTIGYEGIDPAGQLAVTDLSISGNDVLLTFTSVPGRTYRIMGTTNVETGPWVTSASLQGLAGDSQPQTYTLTNLALPALGGRAFFRVEEE